MAQVTGSIPLPVPIATTVKNVATIIVTLLASPSSPSVKLVPFTVPMITKKRIGMFRKPKSSILSGKKGIFMARSICI